MGDNNILRITPDIINDYLSEYVEEDSVVEVEIGGANYECVVKHILTLDEMAQYINIVRSMVFADDTVDNGWLDDFAIRYATVRMFTDIELPKDMGVVFQFLYTNNVYDAIRETIGEFFTVAEMNAYTAISERFDMITSSSRSEVISMLEEVRRITDTYSTFMDTAQKIAGPELFELASKLKAISNDAVAEVTQNAVSENKA